MERRNIILGSLFFLAGAVGLIFLIISIDYNSFLNNKSYEVVNSIVTKKPETLKPNEGTMIFVGDVMLSRSVGDLMAKEGNYRLPFLQISDFLNNADLTFANLEGPISSRGVNVGSKYSFRADPKTIEGLKYAGLDIVSIANNHMWDYGREAFLDTITHLNEAEIDFVGGGHNFDEAHHAVIKDVNGTKVAFLAYTEFLQSVAAGNDSAGLSHWDVEQIKKDIAGAKVGSDLVVVSFHWGEEYKTEHNSKQESMAKTAIDSGADLIIGHHPHVIQEVEQYKNGWIAYSLGNFVFDQLFSKATIQGLVLRVNIKEGKISGVDKINVNINNDYQPVKVN